MQVKSLINGITLLAISVFILIQQDELGERLIHGHMLLMGTFLLSLVMGLGNIFDVVDQYFTREQQNG